MEAKRSHLQNTTQYQANGHRVNTGSSKTQVLKNTSGVSLTPSQAVEQLKPNVHKHPLDALSKLPNKEPTVERRSGLQDVDEDYLKQNIFQKPYFPKNSGLNDVNIAQNQMANPPAAGQPSIHPSEGFVANQITSQAQLKVQQTHVQSPAGTMPLQQNQQTMNAKNQINHNPITVQQDFHQQQQQITPNQNVSTHGHSQLNSGQPQTTIYNNTLTSPEPEMCTTCPNCQTTIYLVRGTDMTHDMTPKVPTNNGGQQTAADTAPAMSAGSA
ncbi:uncharacterized protein LOC135955266 isoform X2 [Calliphora vicina]|uniref:uncharacterized protein LOC135955266 isoform X2 n=1 Tax=Calliphora vicina TaxID=7373 RepID=UPI00325A705A